MPEDKIKAQNSIPEDTPSTQTKVNPLVQAMEDKKAENTKFQTVDESGVHTVSTSVTDASEYDKYFGGQGKTPVHLDKAVLDKSRAQRQSAGEQLGLAVVNQVPNIALNILEQVGYVGALVGEWGDDRDYSNALIEWAKENRDVFGDIYLEDPGDTWDLSDSAWWINNVRSLQESATAFVATGYGVGSVIGKGTSLLTKGLSTLSKSAKTISRIEKAMQIAGDLATSTTMSAIEGAMTGNDVYKQLYSQYKGKINPKTNRVYTEQELKHLASQGAATSVQLNTIINTGLNLSSVKLLAANKPKISEVDDLLTAKKSMTPSEYQDYLKKLSTSNKEVAKYVKGKSYGGTIVKEGFKESAEEGVNTWAQESGLRVGENTADTGEDTSFIGQFAELSNILDDVLTEEGALAMTLGFIGGSKQTIKSDITGLLKKTDIYDTDGNVTDSKRMRNRKIEEYERARVFNEGVKAVIEDLGYIEKAVAKSVEYAKDPTKGSYDVAAADAFNITLSHSLEKGVAGPLINTFKRISTLDNTTLDENGETEAMREGYALKPDSKVYTDPFRERANTAINQIEQLAPEYDRMQTIYNDNDKSIYGIPKLMFGIKSMTKLYNDLVVKSNNNLDKLQTDNNISDENIKATKNMMLSATLQQKESDLKAILSEKLKQFEQTDVDVDKLFDDTSEAITNNNKIRYGEIDGNAFEGVTGDVKKELEAELMNMIYNEFAYESNKLIFNNATKEENVNKVLKERKKLAKKANEARRKKQENKIKNKVKSEKQESNKELNNIRATLSKDKALVKSKNGKKVKVKKIKRSNTDENGFTKKEIIKSKIMYKLGSLKNIFDKKEQGVTLKKVITKEEQIKQKQQIVKEAVKKYKELKKEKEELHKLTEELEKQKQVEIEQNKKAWEERGEMPKLRAIVKTTKLSKKVANKKAELKIIIKATPTEIPNETPKLSRTVSKSPLRKTIYNEDGLDVYNEMVKEFDEEDKALQGSVQNDNSVVILSKKIDKSNNEIKSLPEQAGKVVPVTHLKTSNETEEDVRDSILLEDIADSIQLDGQYMSIDDIIDTYIDSLNEEVVMNEDNSDIIEDGSDSIEGSDDVINIDENVGTDTSIQEGGIVETQGIEQGVETNADLKNTQIPPEGGSNDTEFIEKFSKDFNNLLDLFSGKVNNDTDLQSEGEHSFEDIMRFAQLLNQLVKSLHEQFPNLAQQGSDAQSKILSLDKTYRYILDNVIDSSRVDELFEMWKSLQYAMNAGNKAVQVYLHNMSPEGGLKDGTSIVDSNDSYFDDSGMTSDSDTNAVRGNVLNAGHKIESSSNTVRRLDARYDETFVENEDGEKVVIYRDLDEEVKGTTSDVVQSGDEIEIEVNKEYEGEITDKEGNKQYVKNNKIYKNKENADKDKGGIEMTYDRQPIVIREASTGRVVGYVTDMEWTKRNKRNIADTTDIDVDLSNLEKVRKAIIATGKVITKIINKGVGIVNTVVASKISTISNNLPNLSKTLNSLGSYNNILIVRNGEFYAGGGKIVDNIENKSSYDLTKLTGMPFIVIPGSNNKLIAVPVTTPRLDTNDAATILSLVKAFQTNDKDSIDKVKKLTDGEVDISKWGELTDMLSNFIYLKSFNTDTLLHPDNRGKVMMFIDKSKALRIAEVTSSGTYVVYYLNANGTIKKSSQLGSTTIAANSKAYEDTIAHITNRVIPKMRMNVNIAKINNHRDRLQLVEYKDGHFVRRGEKTYNELMYSKLQTNVMEKKYVHPDGKVSYHYTNQSVITFDTSFTQPDDDENVNSNMFEKERVFKDKLKDGEHIPDYSQVGSEHDPLFTHDAKYVNYTKNTSEGDAYEMVIDIIKPAILSGSTSLQKANLVIGKFDSKEHADEWLLQQKIKYGEPIINNESDDISIDDLDLDELDGLDLDDDGFDMLSMDDDMNALSEDDISQIKQEKDKYILPDFDYGRQKQIISTIIYNIHNSIYEDENGVIILNDVLDDMKVRFGITYNNYNKIHQLLGDAKLKVIFEKKLHRVEPKLKKISHFNSLDEFIFAMNEYKLIVNNYDKLSNIAKDELSRIGLKLKSKKIELENNDLETEENGDTDGYESADVGTKQQYNITSVEKDSKDTATYKLRLILSSVEDVEFVYRDGKKVLDENGNPVVRTKPNYINQPSLISFDTVWDDLQNILIPHSSVKDSEKFDTFINILKSNDKPYLHKLANKLLSETDENKAAFINSMSMQHSNMETVVWRPRLVRTEFKEIEGKWQKKELSVDEQYYEYSMTVINTNRNGNTKVVINSWSNNQKLSVFNNPLIDVTNSGDLIISNERAKYWKDLYEEAMKAWNELPATTRINTPVLNDEQVLSLLNEIGIDYTIEELELLKTPKLLKKYFKHAKYKTYNQLFDKSNGLFTHIINSLNENKQKLTESEEDTIDTLKINNPLSNINTKSLEGLANIQLINKDTYHSNSFKRGDGKTVYGVTMNDYLNHTKNRLVGEDSSYRDKLASVPLTQRIGNTNQYNSYLLEQIFENDNFKDNFKVGVTDTLRKNVSGNKGVLRTKMTNREMEIHQMSLFFNSATGSTKNNEFVSKFIPLVHSDKSRSPLITSIKKFFKPSQYLNSSSAVKDFIFDYMVKPEIMRINDFVNRREQGIITKDNVGEQYMFGGSLFFFFPSLNTDPRVVEMRDAEGRIELTEERIDIFKNIAYNAIKEKKQETLESWKKEVGVYTPVKITDDKGNESTHYQIKFIDKSYLNQPALEGYSDKDKLEYAAWDFELNNILMNINYIQLFAGDVALHSKIPRNISLDNINNIKYFLEDDTNKVKLESFIETTWGEVTKRMAKDIAPGKDGYWVDSQGRDFSNYGQLYIHDQSSNRVAEYYKELGISGYESSKSADAQEYITIKEQLINMHAYARISDDVYNSMMDKVYEAQSKNVKYYEQHINENKERKRKGEKELPFDLNKVTSPNFSDSENKVLMLAMKPVYVGNDVKMDKGYNKITYIKTSSVPLIGSLTKGFEIDKLRQHMELLEAIAEYDNKGKDFGMRATMVTGAKLGAVNVAKIYNTTEDGELEINDKGLSNASPETLNRNGFRLQQEEPYDPNQSDILTVSQANKLLFEGLLNVVNGQAEFDNFNLDIEVDDEKITNTYTAPELKTLKENIRIKLFEKGKQKIIDRLNVKVTKDAEGNDVFEFEDLYKLQEMLRDEAISKGYPINEVEQLQLNEDGTAFRIPIAFSASANRFESLMQSLITNAVTKQMVPGKSYVQMSSGGFKTISDLTENEMNNIVFTDKFNGTNLEWVSLIDSEGNVVKKDIHKLSKEELSKYTVKPAQVIVPFKFRDSSGDIIDIKQFTYKDKVTGRTMLDTDSVDESLLRLIGFRIPNQGHSSMIPIEIVGFLPKSLANVIIVPHEITNQMGSDFDVDHLYTYSANNNTEYTYDDILDDDENTRIDIEYMNWLNVQQYDVLQHSEVTLKTEFARQNKLQYVNGKWQSRTKLNKITKVTYDVNDNDLSKKQLQNAYVDIHWSVLTNPQVMTKLLAPLDQPHLQKLSKSIKDVESRASKTSFLPTSTRYANSMYKANQSGKMGVAIESLASTFLSLIQDRELELNLNDIVNVKLSNDNTMSLRKFGRGGYFNKDGVFITNSDMISMWQSEAVDNAKNLNLNSLHYNSVTASVINVLSMLTDTNGNTMSLEHIVYFIKQPAVIEYVNYMLNKSDTTSEFSSNNEQSLIVENIRAKYITKQFDTESNNELSEPTQLKIPSEKELYNAFVHSNDNNVLSDNEFNDIQLSSLDTFINILENIATPVQDIQRAINYDTKGTGKNLFSSLTKANDVENIIHNSSILNVNNLFTNDDEGSTETHSLYVNSITLANSLWTSVVGNNPILPYSQMFVDKSMDFVLNNSNMTKLRLDDKNNVWKAMKQYFYNNMNMGNLFKDKDGNTEDISDVRRKLLFDTKINKSLATRLYELQQSPDLRNNVFLHRLEVSPTSNINQAKMITYRSDRGERVDEGENIYMFIELITSNDLSHREFAYDLIKYSFVTGGIQTANNFMKYIPTEILNTLKIGEYLDNLKMNDELFTNDNMFNFSRQFFQHNPELATKMADGYIQASNLITSTGSKFTTKGDVTNLKTIEVVSEFTLPPISNDVNDATSLLQYDPWTKGNIGYPNFLTIRNIKNNKWLLYQKSELKSNGEYSYILIDQLGDTDAGYSEYDSSNKSYVRSNLISNKFNLTDDQLTRINKRPGLAVIKYDKQVVKKHTNHLLFDDVLDDFFNSNNNEYSKKQLIDGLSKLSQGVSIKSKLAKLLLKYSDIIPDNITITKGNKNARGTASFSRETGLLTKIDINIGKFFNQDRMLSDKEYAKEQLEEVIIHELLHAVLRNEIEPFLNNKNIKGVKYEYMRELDKIREYVLNNLDNFKDIGLSHDEYMVYKNGTKTADLIEKYAPLSNLHEFISYIMTNKSFQEKMNQIKDDKGNNILTKIKQWIGKIVNELFKDSGIDIEDNSLLQSSISNILNLMDEVKPIGKDDVDVPNMSTEIYNKLGNQTEHGNVEIETDFRVSQQRHRDGNGIYSMRPNFTIASDTVTVDKVYNFGNAFSHVPSEIDKGLIPTKSTKEAVEKYIDWVINSRIENFVNHSGGAKGGDTVWDNEGRNIGINNHQHYTVDYFDKLSQSEKQELDKQYLEVVKFLGRNVISESSYSGKLVRRDMIQANNGDAIYGITELVKPDTKGRKGYVNKMKYSVPEGGTGYAVARGILLNKPVYIFNQSDSYGNEIGWYRWDSDKKDFVKTEIPLLTSNFTGIGSQEINDVGKKAVKQVYEKTKLSEQRAEWIREQLKSGKLKGKPILYYKELFQPSHATALDYLINEYDWGEQTKPNNSNNNTVSDNSTLDTNNTLLQPGARVRYNDKEYILWKINTSNKAQLIDDNGKKFSGTPNIDKLTVLGNYKQYTYNNGMNYISPNGKDVYSLSSGNKVFESNVNIKNMILAGLNIVTHNVDNTLNSLNLSSKKVLVEKNIVVPKGSNPNNLPIFEDTDNIYLMNDGQQATYDKVTSFLNEKYNNYKTINEKTKVFNNNLSKNYNNTIPTNLWDNMFGIIGKAGTGKTTVINKIINDFLTSKMNNRYSSPIHKIFTAKTHNAVTVLQESLGDNSELSKTKNTSTLQSLLKRNILNNKGGLDLMSEEDYLNGLSKKYYKPLSSYDIIVIDESSMIGKDDINDIITRLNQEYSVGLKGIPMFIFMGDYRQLQSIDNVTNTDTQNTRDMDIRKEGIISSTLFISDNKSELSEVMRTKDADMYKIFDTVGEQIDNIRDAVVNNQPIPNVNLDAYFEATVKSTENVLVTTNREGLIGEYTDKLINTNNPYDIFWIRYNKLNKSSTVSLINNIRKMYFNKLGITNITDDIMVNDYIQYTKSFEMNTISGQGIGKGVIKPQSRYKVRNITTVESTLDKLLPKTIGKYFNNIDTPIAIQEVELYNRQGNVRKIKLPKGITFKTRWENSTTRKGKDVKLDIIYNGKIISTGKLPGYLYKSDESSILEALTNFDDAFETSYVGSSHTAQGNSIKQVIVEESNILENVPFVNIRDILSSLYTSLTRASNKLYILKSNSSKIVNNQDVFKPYQSENVNKDSEVNNTDDGYTDEDNDLFAESVTDEIDTLLDKYKLINPNGDYKGKKKRYKLTDANYKKMFDIAKKINQTSSTVKAQVTKIKGYVKSDNRLYYSVNLRALLQHEIEARRIMNNARNVSNNDINNKKRNCN